MNQLSKLRSMSFVMGLTNNASLNKSYCSSTKFCWSCAKPLVKKNSFFCAACGSLQKAEDVNYFQLLNVSSDFDLDLVKLSSNFRRLQSMLHPDKFSQRSSVEKSHSLQWSSLVNKAYKTLNTPIQRGRYILKQNGIQINEENTSVDSEFLMEMMDRNEAVAEATNYEDLDEIAQTLKVEIDELYTKLNTSFRERNLDEAKEHLIKLKYLLNIEQVVKDKLLKYISK